VTSIISGGGKGSNGNINNPIAENHRPTLRPTRNSIANNGLTPFMPVNPTDDPLQQITQNQDLVLYNERCKEVQGINFFDQSRNSATENKRM